MIAIGRTVTSTALATAQRRERQGQQGQGMAEYALILTFVALVVITALTLMGTSITSVFNSVSGSF